MTRVITDYIASGCNCCPQVLDWRADDGGGGWLCYGSCMSLVIAAASSTGRQMELRAVATLVHHHTADIVVCRWRRSFCSTNSGEHRPLVAITGSADRSAAVWWMYPVGVSNDSRSSGVYCLVQPLKGHTASVTHVDALCASSNGEDDDTLVFTAAADHTVRVWQVKAPPRPHFPSEMASTVVESVSIDLAVLCQTIDLRGGLALCLYALPLFCNNSSHVIQGTTDVCLLVSTDDNSVTVMATGDEHDAAADFERVGRLTGHRDWVRCIDAAVDYSDSGGSNDTFLLATAGQDCTIRVWRAFLARANTGSIDEGGDSLAVSPLTISSNTFSVSGQRRLSFQLESVLAAHEGWIYGVRWRMTGDVRQNGRPQLLSASIDSNLLVWQSSAAGDSDIWVESSRIVVNACYNAGFYGCCWMEANDGALSISAHGFRGELYMWNAQHCSGDDDGASVEWLSVPTPGGHYGSVSDLCWSQSASGDCCLLSCSEDRTTRLHERHSADGTWHEYGRPQVHGYDLYCVAFVGRLSRVFVSSGEEKVIRAFGFSAADDLCRRQLSPSLHECSEQMDGGNATEKTASLSALSLTNKPVKVTADNAGRASCTSYQQRRPPSEQFLGADTLWPELRKLYGHGYEVVALASNHAGTRVASACRAARQQHAAVLLWSSGDADSCREWQLLAQLHAGQQLTVIQLAFSPDDRWLLAVSRDRSVSVFEHKPDPAVAAPLNDGWTAHTHVTDAHSRVVWCCAWTGHSRCFLTGSRDKRLLVWTLSSSSDSTDAVHADNDGEESRGSWRTMGSPLVCSDAITAVAVTERAVHGDNVLVALGLESGIIHLFSALIDGGVLANTSDWRLLTVLTRSLAHHSTVRRLQFCPLAPPSEQSENDCVILASCGSDHGLKIHKVVLKGI